MRNIIWVLGVECGVLSIGNYGYCYYKLAYWHISKLAH